MLVPVQRGYVYRAYPTDEVKRYFMQCFGADRKLYNLHVDRLYRFLEKNNYQFGDRVDIKALKAEMPTVATFKKMFTNDAGEMYLYQVDSFASNEAKQHFWSALSEFNKVAHKKELKKAALKRKKTLGIAPTFRDLKGMPKFHSKKNHHFSYTTYNQKNNIQLNGHVLTLPTAQKSPLRNIGVELRLHRPLPADGVIKHVTVSMDAEGAFFVSLCVEFVMDIPDMDPPTRILGLDYSQAAFFVDSEGKKANYPLFMRQAAARLMQEQKKLSRMVKGSNRWDKQRRLIAKLHVKIANQRKDWLHKKAYVLSKKYDMVVLENLDLRFLSQNPIFAKKQQDNGFGNFRLYLKYKLEQQGKHFLKAPKTFASTQICSSCGFKNKELKGIKKISKRTWTCPKCHSHHDRDKNSAKNLKQYGQHHIRERQTTESVVS